MYKEYFSSVLVATIVTLFVYASILMVHSLIEVNKTNVNVTAQIEFNWKNLDSADVRRKVTLNYAFKGDSHLRKLNIELSKPVWESNTGIFTALVTITGRDHNLNKVEPIREFRDTFLIAPGLPGPENITYKTDYHYY